MKWRLFGLSALAVRFETNFTISLLTCSNVAWVLVSARETRHLAVDSLLKALLQVAKFLEEIPADTNDAMFSS